ncbi:MAG: hypothetical protein WA160_13670 [Pseudobdellovibrio sp.]
MTDGSKNFSGLREEWSLLVHSIIDSNKSQDEKNEKLDFKNLTIEQIKVAKRDLSHQRKSLNLKIENIKNRIDQSMSIIESLELVGSESSHVKIEIEKLNIEGEKISIEISVLDIKLNKIHELKDQLILISNPDQQA